MKIRVSKERNGLFFAKLLGVKDIYAEWNTLEEAVKYLLENYQMVIEHKKRKCISWY